MIEDLHSWLYVSSSRLSVADSPAALENLVSVSRSRNAGLGVTGALLFTGTRFLQVIEGPQASIAALQASIRSDSRHENVATLKEGAVTERQFEGWLLAYAGASQFVARRLEQALQHAELDSPHAAASLIHLLEEFSVPV